MNRWPHELVSYTPDEVQLHCVRNEGWQRLRIRMKNIPTERKLDMLYEWYQQALVFQPTTAAFRATEVQVSNYLNALRRGGQLDPQYKVVR